MPAHSDAATEKARQKRRIGVNLFVLRAPANHVSFTHQQQVTHGRKHDA
jgi:hypothetical protein